MNKINFISKEKIEDNIKNLSFSYKFLSCKKLEELHKNKELICTVGTLFKKFGSIKDLLNKYNIEYIYEYKTPNKKILQIDIENNIKELSLKYNELSYKELYKLYKNKELICSPIILYTKIGSIKTLLNKYGIKYINETYGYNKKEIIDILVNLDKNKTYNEKFFNQLYKEKIIPFSYQTIHTVLNVDIKKICKICNLKYDETRYYRLKGKKYNQIYTEEKLKKRYSNYCNNHIWGQGKNEKFILDYIENIISKKIQRRVWFVINKNLIYNVDGYLKDDRIILEVDEEYHTSSKPQINRDKIRENNIISKFNCRFIRINEQKWLNNNNYKYYIINELCNLLKKEDIIKWQQV